MAFPIARRCKVEPRSRSAYPSNELSTVNVFVHFDPPLGCFSPVTHGKVIRSRMQVKLWLLNVSLLPDLKELHAAPALAFDWARLS